MREKTMRKIVCSVTCILCIGFAPGTVVQAQEEPHHQVDGAQKTRALEGVAMIREHVDGYTVSFRVMPATADMRHGGTHNLMIRVEKDGRALHDLLVNSRVSHPIKETENKMMARMGDWYMAGFDLGHPGTHQIMVLFKTPDGKVHLGSIEYRTGRNKK